MGSICAALSRTGDIDRETVVRMIAASPHRGQLDRIDRIGRCWLAVGEAEDLHETDLFVSHDLAAVFNGSLDNIADLLALLERAGHPPPSPTPAGILIAGFRAFGRSLPNYLRGAFAAVLTDGHKMWAFRDHLGFRTLFFRDDGQSIFAATEAKQVLAGAGIKRSPDPEVLEKIFFNELLDEFPCALEGVKRLPKAQLMESQTHSSTFERYWKPESLLETGRYSYEEIAERFDSLFATAVERTLTGTDVVSLSGGIDSPPIAAYGMRPHLEMSGRPLSALSAVYPDQPSVDESEYVRAVADYLDMPLHTYERTAQPLSDLARTVQVLDGPVPKIFVNDTEEHYRKARELGFRTMLTGEVAELVFDRRAYIVPHLLLRGRFRALGRNLRSQKENGVSIANLGRQIAAAFVPRQAAVAYRKMRMPFGSAPVPEFLDRERFKRRQAELMVAVRGRWRQEQQWAFVGPGLTMEADEIMQSICGIRSRRPWADVDLWEFFISLPAEDKAPEHGRKKLVRKLLRGKVPDVILDRKHKTGFDESILARVDYEELQRWLAEPSFMMPGVNYDLLRKRLIDRDLDVDDFMWAKDLAAISAFVRTA